MEKNYKVLFLLATLLCLSGIKNLNAQCVAGFNYSVGSNGSVTFTNTSTSTNSSTTVYQWNFGNLTYTAGIGPNAANPSITYTANGTYIVTMTYSNPCAPTSFSAAVTITNVAGCGLNAGLAYSQGSSGFVSFGNTSTGTVPGTTYTLDFGDNSPVVNNFASNTYSANGTYIATLMASNNSTPACTSTNTFAVNVTSYCAFTPNFTYNVGGNGLVSFQSTSTGTSSGNYYQWYFGDGGSANGTNFVNPSHTYSNGTYTVWLSVMNNSVSPTCTATTQQTITVNTNTCNLSAGFSYTTGANGLVNFSDASTGTISGVSYFWNFDDGTTSTAQSPSHTYASSAPYTVTLTVTNAGNCIDSYVQTVNVTSAPCIANAGFSVAPTNTALVWYATPSFPWNVVGAVWNWGDGSFSWGMYSQHTYSASATYSICLTVTVSCGATATSCSSYFIFRPSQNMQMIQINVVPPALVPTAVEKQEKHLTFDIYPNPSTGAFRIEDLKNANDAKLFIYNITGPLIYEGMVMGDIKLDNIPNGIYLIKIKSGSSEKVKKLVIDK